MKKVTIQIETIQIIEVECNDNDIDFIHNHVFSQLTDDFDSVGEEHFFEENDYEHCVTIKAITTDDAYNAKIVKTEQLEKDTAPWGYDSDGEPLDDIDQDEIMCESFDDAGLNDVMGTDTTAYDHTWNEWLGKNEHLLPNVASFEEKYFEMRAQI